MWTALQSKEINNSFYTYACAGLRAKIVLIYSNSNIGFIWYKIIRCI